MIPCAGCGKPIAISKHRGRQRRTCSNACRQLAFKKRHSGEDIPVLTGRGEWTEDGIEAFVEQLMAEAA